MILLFVVTQICDPFLGKENAFCLTKGNSFRYKQQVGFLRQGVTCELWAEIEFLEDLLETPISQSIFPFPWWGYPKYRISTVSLEGPHAVFFMVAVLNVTGEPQVFRMCFWGEVTSEYTQSKRYPRWGMIWADRYDEYGEPQQSR